MSSDERIKLIFNESMENGHNPPETHFEYDLHKSASEQFSHHELWEKNACSFAYAISNQDVYIKEYDRIIGRIYYTNEINIETADPDLNYWIEAEDEVSKKYDDIDQLHENQLIIGRAPSQGHIAWFWDRILKFGVSGIRKDVVDYLEKASDKKAQEFYSGVIIMLDALINWNDKHIEKLKKMGMDDMAEICRHVPLYPARTFHEAVQSFFMQYIVVMRENPFGGNGPGRLDYYLWPYLERDLNNNICTLSEARYIIDELFIRIDERIHDGDGWVEAVTIGGSYPNGASAVNPLTYIMINSIMDLNITHPSVYIRLPETPPDDFLDLCAKYFVDGSNRAQILSDSSILNAMTKSGVIYRDAIEYACGGCMEIGIQGMTSDFLFEGWFSVVKMVELFVTGSICLKTLTQIQNFNAKGLIYYDSYETFYADFIIEAKRLIGITYDVLDIYSDTAGIRRPSYLISSMIDDCLKRGRNMHSGGAKYHDYGTTPLGMPNAADYLYAIKYAVFDQQICTARELINALKANFIGYEQLQNKLRAIPKYGQENEEADSIAAGLMYDISCIYDDITNRFGGRAKMVIMTFVWAPIAGDLMGATADGNNAGKAVAQGVTPQSSSMTNGITAAMNSCLKMPFEFMTGGASTMWDFDSSWASEPIAKAIITAFLDNGGQIIQGNTTDVETLIKSQKNPRDYANLIVRVGGYSARFVNLNVDLQNDIITRIRHSG